MRIALKQKRSARKKGAFMNVRMCPHAHVFNCAGIYVGQYTIEQELSYLYVNGYRIPALFKQH